MNGIKDQDSIDMMFKNLRESEPYLPGEDFMAAVMAELPQPVVLPAWKKNVLLLTATVIGSGLAASILPAGAIPVNEIISQLTTQIVNLKTLAIAGVAIFALAHRTRRHRTTMAFSKKPTCSPRCPSLPVLAIITTLL